MRSWSSGGLCNVLSVPRGAGAGGARDLGKDELAVPEIGVVVEKEAKEEVDVEVGVEGTLAVGGFAARAFNASADSVERALGLATKAETPLSSAIV